MARASLIDQTSFRDLADWLSQRKNHKRKDSEFAPPHVMEACARDLERRDIQAEQAAVWRRVKDQLSASRMPHSN